MFGFKKSLAMPKPGEALPGRNNPIRTAAAHFVNTRALKAPSGRLAKGDVRARLLLGRRTQILGAG